MVFHSVQSLNSSSPEQQLLSDDFPVDSTLSLLYHDDKKRNLSPAVFADFCIFIIEKLQVDSYTLSKASRIIMLIFFVRSKTS